MMEVFGGWRRKVGCITLLMALALMGGWARSFASTNDHVTVWGNQSLYSHDGSVSWNIHYTDLTKLPVIENPIDPKVRWRWEYCGFVATDTSLYGNTCVLQYWVTYWYLISRLTLISLWLLLSKPRQSTQKKTAQPTANLGA